MNVERDQSYSQICRSSCTTRLIWPNKKPGTTSSLHLLLAHHCQLAHHWQSYVQSAWLLACTLACCFVYFQKCYKERLNTKCISILLFQGEYGLRGHPGKPGSRGLLGSQGDQGQKGEPGLKGLLVSVACLSVTVLMGKCWLSNKPLTVCL